MSGGILDLHDLFSGMIDGTLDPHALSNRTNEESLGLLDLFNVMREGMHDLHDPSNETIGGTLDLQDLSKKTSEDPHALDQVRRDSLHVMILQDLLEWSSPILLQVHLHHKEGL